MIICYTVPEIWRMTEVIIFHFGPFFLPFYPPNSPKYQNLKKKKKMKKKPRDIISLQKCTTNQDHMLYCSWDMARERCNCYFSFWGIFCPFTPNSLKNQNFTKMKKDAWRYHQFILILYFLHKCTKNYDQMMYGS